MKIELKGFQETAADELLKHVQKARRDAADGEPQAVVLSSPTGSGKTVTMTALLERIRDGHGSWPGDPQATFLWFSDSPELNEQSRAKILATSDAFRGSQLVVVEAPFNHERFAAGRVYFLNTGKLGKDSLLTKGGDAGRTIWQTIQNTAAAKPESFYLVIDEAHHGMRETARRAKETPESIVQRFIKGDAAVGLDPVRLVLGMSATPERFETLIHGPKRPKRSCVIDADAVRSSGLLKDKVILYHPREKQPADWSLLAEAARRWKAYRDEWAAYCAARQAGETVEPVLVVQVQDGSGKQLTLTDLDKAVATLEAELGEFKSGALAHCFQEDKPVEAGGRVLRKIEPSKIQGDGSVRVVFFKTALGTGWDCPRAEVMMSFRKAVDHTLIAQLVGRMVRTPLAARATGNEFLNSVALYLPHYDAAGLKAILQALQKPDPENGLNMEVEDGDDQIVYRQDPKKAELFAVLQGLPTYGMERFPKASNTRRLLKLARQLNLDEVDADAWQGAKDLVVDVLTGERERLRKDRQFVGDVTAAEEIEVREVSVDYGEWKETSPGQTIRIRATEENVEDLFARCERILGEGLHMEYWKRHADLLQPLKAKVELYAILQDRTAWQQLEKACGERVDALRKEHAGAVRALPPGKQDAYRRIWRMARKPVPENLVLPPSITVRREEREWQGHLYADEAGAFFWDANSWERRVLEEELKKPEVVGWLRVVPRRDWALCIPYEKGGEDRPLFPDLLVLRREDGQIVVDLFDPHNPKLDDACEKAVGLARYAQAHGDSFRRIALVSVEDDALRRLDLNRESVREKVLKVASTPHLEALFEEA